MTEQEKREKVIKGMEHCIGDNCNGDKWSECKYSGHGCIDALLKDALALLEAQEPGNVNISIVQSDGWKKGNCPFCGMNVDSFYNWSFCGTCGRELKWE